MNQSELRRLTTASSLTAARERFLLNLNGHSGAAAAEAEAFGPTAEAWEVLAQAAS